MRSFINGKALAAGVAGLALTFGVVQYIAAGSPVKAFSQDAVGTGLIFGSLVGGLFFSVARRWGNPPPGDK